MIDYCAKRLIAWPLALIGLAFSLMAEGLIRTAAWLCDVDPDAEDECL